jgi:predicted nucleic acid-binding protein
VLPALFQKVILQSTVREELDAAPPAIRDWIAAPPSWVELRQTRYVHDPVIENLDAGEEDAIALAVELRADLLLMDDRDGVRAAGSNGISVLGMLGILGRAAQCGLPDLAFAL